MNQILTLLFLIIVPSNFAQTSLSDLNRGWRTPDPASKPVGIERDDLEEDVEEEGGIFQRMGIIKTPSLDWRHRPGGPAMLSEKQRRSVQEIKAHKQKVLDESFEVEEQGNDDSKKRLIESDDSTGNHDLDDGSKTSFLGCVCNVANTLLVSQRIQLIPYMNSDKNLTLSRSPIHLSIIVLGSWNL